jgi:hypothetical protein
VLLIYLPKSCGLSYAQFNKLNISNIQVIGTVLAAAAEVHFPYGSIVGSIVASSMACVTYPVLLSGQWASGQVNLGFLFAVETGT